MTPDEVWARLAAAHTGIVTTLRRDGMPIATPMWFCVHDDAVHFGTPSRSKKAGRLRRDPRVGFLVESGTRWAELWAVHVAGVATIVEEQEAIDAVGAVMAEKYAGFSTPRI